MRSFWSWGGPSAETARRWSWNVPIGEAWRIPVASPNNWIIITGIGNKNNNGNNWSRMSYFPAAQSTKNGESTGIIGDYYVFLGALKQIHDIPRQRWSMSMSIWFPKHKNSGKWQGTKVGIVFPVTNISRWSMSVPSSAFRIVTVFQNCFKGKICSGESLKTVSRTVSGPPIVPGTNQWFPLYFPLNQSIKNLWLF